MSLTMTTYNVRCTMSVMLLLLSCDTHSLTNTHRHTCHIRGDKIFMGQILPDLVSLKIYSFSFFVVELMSEWWSGMILLSLMFDFDSNSNSFDWSNICGFWYHCTHWHLFHSISFCSVFYFCLCLGLL